MKSISKTKNEVTSKPGQQTREEWKKAARKLEFAPYLAVMNRPASILQILSCQRQSLGDNSPPSIQATHYRRGRPSIDPGQIGAFLRRKGLYSSNLTHLRRQAPRGDSQRHPSQKTRMQVKGENHFPQRVTKFEKGNRKLQHQLRLSDIIIKASISFTFLLRYNKNPPHWTPFCEIVTIQR